MPRIELPVLQDKATRPPSPIRLATGAWRSLALMGNPNSGKTTIFNALTGLRSQTSNFAGTTVELRRGRFQLNGEPVELIDLPGTYSLQAATPDEKVACDLILGRLPDYTPPEAVLLTADSTNLERNLFLASQLIEQGTPLIIALTMCDIAHQHGLDVDAERLSSELGCPVIPVSVKQSRGLDALKDALHTLLTSGPGPVKPLDFNARYGSTRPCGGCSSCPYHGRFDWTEEVTARVVKSRSLTHRERTDRIDRFLTQPVIGLGVFAAVMLGLFYLIFSAAQWPMELIDGLFARSGAWINATLPANDLRSLLSEGVVGGVGGILVFLPQICILFFFLALLEDTGYLSRAAFVLDCHMRRVGLPGNAFVPLLSAHACAIPAIMATRIIGDRRDRLLTILVLPLITCSARIPVYAMVVALVFPHDALRASLLFSGAYGLGIVAVFLVAFILRRTILPGESKPLILELPGYKIPSLRNALLITADRATVFIKQAGTLILLISVILWVLATYPKSEPPAEALANLARAETLRDAGDSEAAHTLNAAANHQIHRHALEHSIAGRMGKIIEPLVAPLGFDWQIGVGIISSFAAREVVVSTLSIVYGMGADAGEEQTESLYATLRKAQRPDGTPTFTTATSISLLVFYVLAMQCLPTQAITRRETGSWKWAGFQLAYMSVLAYTASLLTYQGLRYFMG